ETLRQAVAEQQKAIESMTKVTPATAVAAPAAVSAPRPLVASSSPMAIPGGAASPSPKFTPPLPQPEAASPLQLKIGETSIIPIGFMDATAEFRDKNAG